MSRVAVLKGGSSLEREVSLRSGSQVEDALERLGHAVVPIDVGGDLVARLREERPEVAFIALHGRDGEDGTVQELLELVGVPYTGSGVSACGRSADKALAKRELQAAGVPTPEFFAFTLTAFEALGAADALPEIEERLAFPIVVKPASGGSALGIRIAHAPADVPPALVSAFSYDAKVLLERHVRGRELAVSLLDGVPLPVVEAIPRGRADVAPGIATAGVPGRPAAAPPGRGAEPPYDFEARYEIGKTHFVCPAGLPDAATHRAQEVAVATWRALGLAGFARVDLILEEATGELHVLEANPVPGLTETSLLPQAAEAAGLGFDDLVARVLALAGPCPPRPVAARAVRAR